MNVSPAPDAYADAIEFLYGRLNYERTDSMPYGPDELKLDRMRRLLSLLGDPHIGPHIVHVAGTKGKGSTSHFLSSILTHSGYRTGCYTSPHLLSIEERFAVDGQACSPQDIVRCVDRLRRVVAQIEQEAGGNSAAGPTFFELATAMAFLHFQDQSAEFIVLEVGLGGRLDSTNVCCPRASVITSISFDHMRQLGNTLGGIAREKAGIIKSCVPVITGVTQDEPWRVIEQIADQQRAPVHRLGRDFDFAYHAPDMSRVTALPTMDYFYRRGGQPHGVARHVTLSALGAHQAANASLAWSTCESLVEQGFAIPETAIRQGLAGSRCPGRIEILRQQPTMVIDTAHNAASIQALVQVLRESFTGRPRTLILAATQGKDVDGMLLALVPEFDTIICTQYLKNPRAMPVDELNRHTRRIATAQGCVVDLISCASPQSAWEQAVSDEPLPELICATGSFFLAAEIKALLIARASIDVHGRALN
jgi:dihydrofolate synthase/folylpolyglutamate synthase